MTGNSLKIPNDYLRSRVERVTSWFSRRKKTPIADAAGLCDFVATRAALIAQKKLYGYLKTRIGTRYPKVFDDPPFVESMNIAKMHVFAACLSDLATFAVARALNDDRFSDADRRAMALRCFDKGLADNESAAIGTPFNPHAARADFLLRLDGTDWRGRAQTRENFDRSPTALVRWAPIAPELKALDAEIVENSVKFAWAEIRRDFETRLDAGAMASDVDAHLKPDRAD